MGDEETWRIIDRLIDTTNNALHEQQEAYVQQMAKIVGGLDVLLRDYTLELGSPILELDSNLFINPYNYVRFSQRFRIRPKTDEERELEREKGDQNDHRSSSNSEGP